MAVPTCALAISLIAGAAIAADGLAHHAQAVFLLIPVAGAAAVAGRRAAGIVGIIAIFAFALLLPPIGSPNVHLGGDRIGLLSFGIGVVAVGALVAARVDALRRVEEHHAAHLRAVSHDLRTPLAAIQAALSELEQPDLHGGLARVALAATARKEAQRLDRMVANLLSLARIEADALRPSLQPVDLGDLAASTVARLSSVLAHVEVELRGEAVPELRADPSLLSQVVANLLENAARHTPPGGHVVVQVVDGRAEVVIEVLDDGDGIPAGELASVFEPFRSGAHPGTGGVGLAICKAVVEAHGGSIAASNREPSGAAFTVRLPRG